MATHSIILIWRIPRNRGAWRATIHRVTKIRTRLKRFSLQAQRMRIGNIKKSLWLSMKGGVTKVPVCPRLRRFPRWGTLSDCNRKAAGKLGWSGNLGTDKRQNLNQSRSVYWEGISAGCTSRANVPTTPATFPPGPKPQDRWWGRAAQRHSMRTRTRTGTAIARATPRVCCIRTVG